MFNNNKSNIQYPVSNIQKGVSLYLALVIMTIILAVALGLATIFLSQFKQIREMGNSVVALYAADTGIERGLKEADSLTDGIIYYGVINDASYQYRKEPNDDPINYPDCQTAQDHCISASGFYKNTVRAIRVSR